MTKHIFWLASYPKSGNTLLRAILSSLFFTENGVFNFKLLESITNFEDTYFVSKMKKLIGNDLNKLDTHFNNTYTTDEKLEISKKRLQRNLKVKENRLNDIRNNKKNEIEYQIQEIEIEIKDYKIELMNTGCNC